MCCLLRKDKKREERGGRRKALPERVQHGRTMMADVISAAEKDHKREFTFFKLAQARLSFIAKIAEEDQWEYAIPKINMLHNLSCCETRFRLLCC